MSTAQITNMAETVLGFLSVIPEPRSVLLAGSGPNKKPEWAELGFATTYLDIEPRNNPDIVADMCDVGEIGPYSIVFCCHALEHLYPHQVNWALREFKRILHPGGVAIVMVPDLEDVRPDNIVLDYPAESGPITGLHLYYGDHNQIPEFPHMAHHCGFVKETLTYALECAEFDKVATKRMEYFNLLGIGYKKHEE